MLVFYSPVGSLIWWISSSFIFNNYVRKENNNNRIINKRIFKSYMYYICIIISHTFDDIAHFDVKKIIYNQRKNIHVCCNNNNKNCSNMFVIYFEQEINERAQKLWIQYLLLKYLNKKYFLKKTYKQNVNINIVNLAIYKKVY